MFVKSSTAAATLASEEVLVESSVRSTSIHAGGWVGFKPSDYGNGVSVCLRTPDEMAQHRNVRYRWGIICRSQ